MIRGKLTQICSAVVDCKNRTAPEDPNGSHFAVGTPAMRGNIIDLSEARRINDETYAEWTARITPEPGDLLFAREAPVGPVVEIPEGVSIAPGQRTMLLRADPSKANSRFLRYYLISPSIQARIQSLAHGSTVPHLRLSVVRNFEVELPDLEKQHAIAEVLGSLDDKIAANTKLARTSDELAGALFDRLTDPLPSQVMSSILDPILGGTPARSNRDFWDGGELWASAKDITGAQCSVVLDTEEKITTSAVENTKAKPLPSGSVIITARGTVGAVARLGIPAAFNQSCYGFLPDRLPPSLLYFSLRRAAEQAKSLVHGSVFDTITKRTFDHLLIPDFGDSADATEARISPLLDLVTAKLEENHTLESIRDTLLPPLISGKLRVKDAEKIVEDAV